MKKSKRRDERFFENLSGLMIRFRYVVLFLVLMTTALLGSQIRYLQFDTSNEGFLHEDDPIMQTYNVFRDQFGRDDMLAITIHSKEIFSTEFIKKLTMLHEQLWDDVPYVNDITSMVNARNTRGEGDVLLVDDLLKQTPQSEQDLMNLKRIVMSNPLYINQLISEDGMFTTIVIESDVYTSSGEEDDLLGGFDEQEEEPADGSGSASGSYLSDQENSEFVRAVKEVAAQYSSEDFVIHVAGSPIVMHTIKQFMKSDVKKFLRLAVIIIGLCLFIMFRRISGVALPLITVALSLVTTMGVMVSFGVSFKLPTTILPSFLLAVGVGASVHVLSLTYQNIRHGAEKRDAIVSAYSHSGFAIIMTSLTTAAGLASFSLAEVAPIADLCLFSAIGVMISLLYTMTFLPALLSLLPHGKKDDNREDKMATMDRILDAITDFAVDKYKIVLAISCVMLLVGVLGVAQIRFSHNVLEWLPEDLDVRQATEVIDKEMKGSVVLEVIVDTGRENGLYDRNILLAIEKLMTNIEEDFSNREVFVGKTISVTTILKEIHQALHGNNPDYYKISDNEKLIPQEFLLFENSGSDDLGDVVDSQFRKLRVSMKVPWQDALLYRQFMEEINERFVTELKSIDTNGQIQVTITGIMALFGRIIHAAMFSAAQSYGIALVVISIMMILLIGNLRLGLISMIPNLSPIILVLGFMGWANIQLDMFTMLIASIAIGLAVDDTVHFMYNFKRYYEKVHDVKEAVSKTLHTAGRAMITTSVVLSIGFFIFTFASMNNLYYFGLLIGVAIILALAADLFLAPALMALVIQDNKKQLIRQHVEVTNESV